MKTRRVFSTPDLPAARRAIAAAKQAGVADDSVSLIARSDIELEQIPSGRQEAETDFKPALARGAGVGGGLGLLAGIAAIAIPPIGVTIAGALTMTVMGAIVGGWTAALFGSTVPDPVKRRFEDEIESGRILVVVDVANDDAAALEAALQATGAEQLPYDAPTIMS
jgi:hypothetical protein